MFRRGKIDISIQNTSYALGDTITGVIELTLKKPLKAREMTIALIGEYRTWAKTSPRLKTNPNLIPGQIPGVYRSVRARTLGANREMLVTEEIRKSAAPQYELKKSIDTVHIYGFKDQLEGETEYSESKRYHFKIKITTDMPTSSAVNWYLMAKLDVPHGQDIMKKARIIIE